MAARTLVRAVPSVLVGVLVLAAAAAQSGPANPFRRLLPAKGGAFSAAARGESLEARDATPAAIAGTTCESVTGVAISTRPVIDARAWQADAVTSTAQTLSFGVHAATGGPVTFTAELAFFEPGLADPRLGAYPLHRATLTASGLGEEMVSLPLDRPIVVHELDPVAGVTWTAALSYGPETGDPLDDQYDPAGPLHMRPAMYEAGAIGFVPLAGPHPVLRREVCGSLYANDTPPLVLRQVIRSDVAVTSTADLVQTFTCPITVTADWVELAIASPPGGLAPLAVELFDMQGAFEPPFVSPATSTATTLDAAALAPPVWGASTPLTTTATLEAGRRYALRVVCDGQWSLGAALSPGGSGYPDGELWSRPAPGTPFALEPDLDLSFRLIGRVATVTAELPPDCDLAALSRNVTASASVPLSPDRVVVQPLTVRGDDFGIGGVSLRGPGSGATTTVILDFALSPLGSPPDPSRVALRPPAVATFTAELPPGSWSGLELPMPLVTTAVTGVAHGADDYPMLRLRGGYTTSTSSLDFDEASTLPMPAALYEDGGSGSWQPLPGPHPVLAHVVCPTGTASFPLRVAQQLLRGGHPFPGTSTASLLQSFRVPVTTEVSWAELGLRFGGGVTTTAVPVGLMAPGVCTCTADPDRGIPLVASTVLPWVHPLGTTITADPAFHATQPFAQPVTLTPGVDYWIHVTTTADLDVEAADASPYTEGRLYSNAGGGLPYVEETDRDLAFRLIGVPRALMAGPATPTCNGCWDRVFEGVTTTAGFDDGSGGGAGGLRTFGQVVTVTAGVPVEAVRVPVGADGGGVTVVVGLHFTEEAPDGRRVPVTDGYPIRVGTITASAGDMNWAEGDPDRPIVVRSWGGTVTGTADGHLGITVGVKTPTAELETGRAKVALGAEAVCTCTAALERSAGGDWQPLPGLALGHAVRKSTLTADLGLFEMAAVRDVRGVTLSAELIQSFRVPVASRVQWVELAVPGGQEPAPPFEVEVLDPLGFDTPADGLPTAVTFTAQFPYRDGMAHGSTWSPSERVAPTGTAVLVPGRDYWLRVRPGGLWDLASAPTGTATLPGRLYTRSKDGTWSEQPGALAFRLIAEPIAPLDAPVPVTPGPGLAFSAEPQPFTRELSLRWSGGAGRASVEIFDATGRRVRHVRDAGAAASGAWTWRGEDDSGRSLGAGVYFARVTPTTGPAMRRRVVYLR